MIEIFSTLAVFIFGAIVGSFLNVVILRWNTGRAVTKGRSYCFTCNTKLTPIDLIPILSYILLRGRCRQCKSKISAQYLIVEFATAIFATLVYLMIGISPISLLAFVIGCILLVITIYDFRHTIIPDELVYSFIFLTLVYQVVRLGSFSNFVSWVASIDFLIGPLLFIFFASFWYFSKGKWMGLGDAKLALGIGWLLGGALGFSAIMLAFWTGAIWGIVALFLHRKSLTMKSEIPFAPFLIFGVALIALTGISVFSVINLTY